jgi:L-lactate dehydrogenase complex protein LldG
MTTSRDRILARIRAGLARTRPALEAEAAAPHAPPPFVHPAETDDLAQQFAAQLTRLQAHPHLCADEEAALDVIQAVLERHDGRAVIAWDLEQVGLPGLHALLEARGVTVHDAALGSGAEERALRLQALEPAPVCISGVDALIAESATVALRAGPGRPRLASLLAPVYIAVARRAQLVRGLGEALARLRETYGRDILEDASALTLITGPSRTADIELTLTLGVHGPREVHVVIVG